jgi:hypothetical protein
MILLLFGNESLKKRLCNYLWRFFMKKIGRKNNVGTTGGTKEDPPKKVVDLTLLKGRKKDLVLSPDVLTELRRELEDYKISLPKDHKLPAFHQVAQALIDCDGFVMKSAIKLGVSYARLHKIIQSNEKLKNIIEDARNAFVDLAENKLRDAVLQGQAWAVIFALKCKGRDRGWIEDPAKNIDSTEQKKTPLFNYSLELPKGFKLVAEEKEEPIQDKEKECAINNG